MLGLQQMDFTFGIKKLLPEWKNMFTSRNLAADVIAGTTVAFVAIPLSLAIALASGVSPATGLITAIIAGFVCAIFGGTSLAVSGPAAAMSVLIADIVEKQGVEGLVLICLLAGAMQLVSGMAGLGKLGRYVPLPVIAGFTAGIGVIILIGQLPRAFGLAPPPESHIIDVFNHIKDYFHEINGACLLLVFVTIGIIRGMPKVLPKIPSILPAVAVASVMVYFFNLDDVPLIGAIPRSLPAPHFPIMPAISFNDLFLNAFSIYLLASLETLLSSSAVDKLTSGKKHDSDQELIGQGMGNMAVSFFGGIPITGVIARSATNIRAGAKSRRSSIIHSLIILLTVLFAAPLISKIPIAALAGVLFSVAFSMINYREFHDLWSTSRSEGIIYIVTFFTIIFVDLLAGVQAGIIAAAVLILTQSSKTHLHISASPEDDTVHLTLTGSLTFLSSGKIADLQKKLEDEYTSKTIFLDLSSIRSMDTSGATAIVELYTHCRSSNIQFYIKGLSRRFERFFTLSGGQTLIDDYYLISEHELRKKDASIAPKSSHGRLVHGVHRFYVERKHNDKRLFEYISQAQDPHTLFIACSDSRLIPSLITSTDPGELFIIRNVGNFIPPYHPNIQCSEAAAIEFALSSLDITDIVVCGHANCGAMKACMSPESISDKGELAPWIAMIKSQLILDEEVGLNDIAQMNILNQLANLKKYPLIQKKLNEGTLSIHAWFLDLDSHLVYEYQPEVMTFKSITPEFAQVQ